MKSRPTLPATSSDFALPPPSTGPGLNGSNAMPPFPSGSPSEEFAPLTMLRFHRSSLLAPTRTASWPEARLHSPLATSFTLSIPRRYSTSVKDEAGDESESDRDKMWTDSPPSVDSGATTPSLSSDPSEKSLLKVGAEACTKTAERPPSPSTPPRLSAKFIMEPTIEPSIHKKVRRLSQPIRIPRILSLVSEAHPEEAEVKSEAQFRRLVASCSDLPLQPRTPRAPSDRGRFPEEADTSEPEREGTPSDEEEEIDFAEPSSFPFVLSESINFIKPTTPAQSVIGDDFSVDSPGCVAMDVDVPMYCGSPGMSSWRYTPPPTCSAVRSSKRKFDDRYDPYPTSNKRRAVSPSVSLLRESQSSLFNPRTPNGNSRVPIPIPIPIPMPITIPSGMNSGASSPVIPSFSSRPLSIGSASVLSSPTLRAQMGLASPILRPMMRSRRDTDGKEVEGAGEAVNGLSLE